MRTVGKEAITILKELKEARQEKNDWVGTGIPFEDEKGMIARYNYYLRVVKDLGTAIKILKKAL